MLPAYKQQPDLPAQIVKVSPAVTTVDLIAYDPELTSKGPKIEYCPSNRFDKNSKIKNICVVTGSRAEYGLLLELIKKINISNGGKGIKLILNENLRDSTTYVITIQNAILCGGVVSEGNVNIAGGKLIINNPSGTSILKSMEIGARDDNYYHFWGNDNAPFYLAQGCLF